MTGGTISLNAALPSSGTVNFNMNGATSALSISGVISGGAGLTEAGGGTLTLSGANTYSGATAIQNGTIAVGFGDNRLPTGTSVTLGDSINDAGTLKGARRSWRRRRIELQTLAGLFTTGTGADSVTVGGASSIFTLNVGSSETFGGVISAHNVLELVKSGTGTLNLTNGSNDFYSTSVNQGILSFANGALGANPIIGMEGGTLQWASGNTQDVSSYLGMYLYAAGNLDTNGNNVTLSGVIQSVGTFGLTKIGSGTLTLSGANTFTGPTTVSAGTLAAGLANTVPSSSAVTVASGATFVLDGYSQSIGSLTGAGNVTNNSNTAATLTVGTDNTSPAAFSGVISDTTGTNTGSLSLVKLGTGTLTLTGASTYSGSTAIQNGILATSGGLDNRLPTTTSVTLGDSSNDAGMLQLGVRHGGSTANQTLAGLFTTGTGASSVTVGAGTSILTLNVSGSDTFGGTIIGHNVLELVKNGTGTLTVTNGSNDYYSTAIYQGVVSFASGALGQDIIGMDGGTLQWASGNTQDVSSPYMYFYAPATFDTNGNNVTLSGVIENAGVSSSGLTKVGGGTLTLTGANTFTGPTNVNGGSLAIGNADARSSTSDGHHRAPAGPHSF